MVTCNRDGIQEVAALEVGDGRVAAMYVVRNPEKLRAVSAKLAAS